MGEIVVQETNKYENRNFPLQTTLILQLSYLNPRKRAKVKCRLSSQISLLKLVLPSPGRISRIYVFPRTVDARHAGSSSRREPAASGFFIKAQPRGSPLWPHVPGLIPERPSIILKPVVIKLDGQFHPKTSNAAIA